jgi:FkbM family methyltransferase
LDLLTPYRFLTSLPSSEGRKDYSRAWRYHIWRLAQQLPGGVRLNCWLDGKLRIRVSSADQTVSKAVYFNGIFEAAEVAFIREVVGPGMTVVDVGANIGVHTLTLADCVGPSGIVHAFEPTDTFDRLRENIRLNNFKSRTRLNQCALGAGEGTLRLFRCRPGYEAYTSRGMPLSCADATGERFDVPLVSLDLYAERAAVGIIDFAKIDVEGSEPEVFHGAARLIGARRIRCVMFEVNETCLGNCGSSAAELMGMVRAMGFDLRLLARDGTLRQCSDVPHGDWTTVVGRL